MARHSLRDTILEAGLKVMFRSGYNGSSVRDIVAAAGAPQGSFTNHFRCKEAFASEVLDRYFAYVKGLVAEALNDSSLTPRGAAEALSRHHHQQARSRAMEPRLPDRRPQPGGAGPQRAAARASRCDLSGMAGAVRDLHCRGAGCGRNRARLRSNRSRRFPARIMVGGNSAHESGAQPSRPRALQDHCLPNRLQGANLMQSAGVTLRQQAVLDSTMAYREAGSTAPVALFLHGNRHPPTSGATSSRTLPASPIALRRT